MGIGWYYMYVHKIYFSILTIHMMQLYSIATAIKHQYDNNSTTMKEWISDFCFLSSGLLYSYDSYDAKKDWHCVSLSCTFNKMHESRNHCHLYMTISVSLEIKPLDKHRFGFISARFPVWNVELQLYIYFIIVNVHYQFQM